MVSGGSYGRIAKTPGESPNSPGTFRGPPDSKAASSSVGLIHPKAFSCLRVSDGFWALKAGGFKGPLRNWSGRTPLEGPGGGGIGGVMTLGKTNHLLRECLAAWDRTPYENEVDPTRGLKSGLFPIVHQQLSIEQLCWTQQITNKIIGCGSKLTTRNWTAGFSPCFNLPGLHSGCFFTRTHLTHSPLVTRLAGLGATDALYGAGADLRRAPGFVACEAGRGFLRRRLSRRGLLLLLFLLLLLLLLFHRALDTCMVVVGRHFAYFC